MDRNLASPILAMVLVVVASNYCVQFPINDWVTYGAITYPISYLITELTSAFYGPRKARLVVYIGFSVAVCVSMLIAPIKIAAASALAFLCSQLLDIYIFSSIRNTNWWYAPFAASSLASISDSSVFWTLAFWGEDLPIFTLAAGDTLIKIAIDVVMLVPFRWFLFKSYSNISNSNK